MKFKSHSLVGFIATFLMATQAFANNNASVASSTTIVQDPRHGSILSGFVQLSRSTSLYDYQDGTRKDSMDYMARFNLKFSRDYTIRLDGSFSQDLKNSDSSDVGDTSLSLVRAPVPLGKTFLLSYKLAGIAPTSKDSHVRQNMQGAASAGLSVLINPDRLIPGLSLVGSASLRRNFHQYDTAMDGSVNTQYSSAQSFAISYDFSSHFTLSGTFTHVSALTYQNNIKEAFEHYEEIDYNINDTFTLGLGHTNSGNMLKANGQDSNLALVNDNTSMVYASLTAAF